MVDAIIKHLMNLVPYKQVEIAEKIGIHRTNLSAALQGNRRIPLAAMTSLLKILGLPEDEGKRAAQVLRNDRVHIWTPSVRTEKSLHAVLDRLPRVFIGGDIDSADEGEGTFFVPIVVPLAAGETPILIACSMRRKGSGLLKPIQISPKSIPGAAWLDFEAFYGGNELNLATKPTSLVLQAKDYDRLSAGIMSPRELLARLATQADDWTWSKILLALKSKAQVPSAAAKLLSLPDSYGQWFEETYGGSENNIPPWGPRQLLDE